MTEHIGEKFDWTLLRHIKSRRAFSGQTSSILERPDKISAVKNRVWLKKEICPLVTSVITGLAEVDEFLYHPLQGSRPWQCWRPGEISDWLNSQQCSLVHTDSHTTQQHYRPIFNAPYFCFFANGHFEALSIWPSAVWIHVSRCSLVNSRLQNVWELFILSQSSSYPLVQSAVIDWTPGLPSERFGCCSSELRGTSALSPWKWSVYRLRLVLVFFSPACRDHKYF